MIEHGASIEFINKICTIRLNKNYPYKSFIEKVLHHLRSKMYCSNYIDKYLKFNRF